MYFSELHVELLARGIMQPGESLVAKTVTSYKPWWAFGFINRQYLVLATDRRLVLADHRAKLWGIWTPLQLFSVDSIPWQSMRNMKLKGLLSKKLVVDGQGERGPVKMSMAVPKAPFGPLAVMRGNVLGAKNVATVAANAAAAQQQQPALAPAWGQHPSLPPAMAAHGAPPGYPQQAQAHQPSYPPQSGYPQQQPAQQPQGYAPPPPPPPQQRWS